MRTLTALACAEGGIPAQASGTAFPANPLAGDSFYRTDLSAWFYWDASRSKWLSFHTYDLLFGVTSSVSGAYLRVGGAGPTSSGTSGYRAPVDWCIVSASVSVTSTVTTVIRIMDDGVLNSFVSLTAVASAHDNALNGATIAAGSFVGCVSTAASGVCVVTVKTRQVAT